VSHKQQSVDNGNGLLVCLLSDTLNPARSCKPCTFLHASALHTYVNSLSSLAAALYPHITCISHSSAIDNNHLITLVSPSITLPALPLFPPLSCLPSYSLCLPPLSLYPSFFFSLLSISPLPSFFFLGNVTRLASLERSVPSPFNHPFLWSASLLSIYPSLPFSTHLSLPSLSLTFSLLLYSLSAHLSYSLLSPCLSTYPAPALSPTLPLLLPTLSLFLSLLVPRNIF
jgi:hypothetical protein